MGTWTGLLFLAVVGYFVVVLVRALIQFGTWLVDRFITEPRERAAAERERERGHHDAAERPKEGGILSTCRQTIVFAMLRALYRLSGFSAALRFLVPHRDFGFWVGQALGENDPETRIKYCSKALKLNPDYEPAWGLKAVTLFGLKRFEEASACFDKVLEMRPNAMAWHKKGVCCYHLNRHQQALACFEKSLAASADKDPQLFGEASRYQKLLLEASAPVV
jgi:tetratricopeptide (TPR) repeat protein